MIEILLKPPHKRDPRRAQERADSRMIQEDHEAMANLSPIPIHREWPKETLYPSPWWDDTVKRSRQEDSDPSKDVNGIAFSNYTPKEIKAAKKSGRKK